MKVCLIGARNDFSNATGNGVSRYMYELAKNLRKIRAKDFNLRVHGYPPYPFIGSGLTPFVHSISDDYSRYDIVHSLDVRPMMRIRHGKAIFVNTVHDFHSIIDPGLFPEDYSSVGRLLGLHLVLLPGMKTALKSDYLVVNSTQTRDEAVKLGFERRKIFVTNLGLDRRFFSKLNPDKRNSKFTVGYIGGMSWAKNVAFAINAFKKSPGKAMRFEIWGNPDRQYECLKRLSSDDNRIRFMGFAPENRIVSIYDSFSVFVHPTLHEGFGLPIIEAQSRGLPVIIYKKAKIPEEVRRYCLEAKDEEDMAGIITRIRENGYENKERRKTMAYARQFSWKRMARETFAAYRKMIEERDI